MLTRVEKYEITDEIGYGGMATVYRARDTRLDRLVALKVMHPHLQGAKEARARFAREALTVARLRHPGILEIYDYSGEDSDICYIATELLTGPTLKQFADEHQDILAEIAACFVIAVARALKAAHAEGVIHRDVKPENVLIHENREVKLTDFGIALLVDAQSMTTTGQVLGSPGHMAPEQIEGQECGVSSDLFSLGTVLYLLATGKLPFSGKNPHQVLKQIAEGKFVEPILVKASIGAKLNEIILRCLKTDPKMRYQSASELEQDLTAFVAEISIESPVEALAEYLSDPQNVSSKLQKRTVEYMIQAGETAQAKGDIPNAMNYFNRALALDEERIDIIEKLSGLGRRSFRRRLIRFVSPFFVALILVLGWFVISDSWGETVLRSSGINSAPEQQAQSNPTNSPKTQEPKKPSNSKSEILDRNKVATSHKSTKGKGRNDLRTGLRGRNHDDLNQPRNVIFQPFPANVSIGIDGADPKAFGPSFRSVELSSGVHLFRFIGAHDCCIDEEFSVEIPPGPGSTMIQRSLRFRAAGLYVVSNTPASVVVDDGEVSGRTRSVIQVSHERSLLQTHRITVTAPGYRDYTIEVQLQAGKLKTVEVTLEKNRAE